MESNDLHSSSYADEMVRLKARIIELEEQLRLATRHRFSFKSEALNHPGLVPLFPDLKEEDKKKDETVKETTIPEHKRKITRKKPPDNLRREEIIIDLPEHEKTCSCCSKEMEKVSEKVSEKMHIQPAEVFVKKFIRPVYSCKDCQNAKQANMPAHILPKCSFTHESIAWIIIQKYMDGMPLHRIEKSLERQGIEVPRGKMARWVIKTAKILKPLVQLMQAKLLESCFFGIDETKIQVLKEKGRRADQKSFMIVQAGSMGDGKDITLFHYEKSRSAETIKKYFEGFTGHIVSDGLMVYQSILDTRAGVTHGGCWSHARRKFMDAVKGKKKSSGGTANQFVQLIDDLFDIEKKIKGKPPDEVKKVRQEESKKIIENIDELLKEKLTAIPKKSLTGKALNYLANQWEYLTRFLDHPELPIHNNHVENEIRPIAVGRKAWLFADTTEGAEASAIYYSLLMTAKRNGRNPQQYLCDVFSRIHTEEDLELLLPFATS